MNLIENEIEKDFEKDLLVLDVDMRFTYQGLGPDVGGAPCIAAGIAIGIFVGTPPF